MSEAYIVGLSYLAFQVVAPIIFIFWLIINKDKH
jgi:hypothetical protein